MITADNRRTGRKRVLLTAGVLVLGLGVTVTAAAQTDFATGNLGADGIGFPHRFDLGLVLPDGSVEQADAPEGVEWIVDGAADLVPGHEITTTIPVFNNTPTLGVDTMFEITLRNQDGSVGGDVPNITQHLRFSASVDDVPVFDGVTWDQATAALGLLEPRGSEPLAQGQEYAEGEDGSAVDLELTIEYLDSPGVEALNGGQSALAVRFFATSEVA